MAQTLNKKNLPKLIVILGPTASGKSDLAIKLARKFHGEIINADSRNVYKEMYIGTASPFSPVVRSDLDALRSPLPIGRGRRKEIRPREVKGISHHLFHYFEPWKAYSVGQYKQDAIKVINNIIARGKAPIMVGGTGLYIWAVVDNLEIPEVPPNQKLRRQLMEPSFVLRLCKEVGLVDKTLSFGLSARGGRRKLKVKQDVLSDLLWKILIKLDPKAAEFIQKNNPRRVIRALEVILTLNQRSLTKRSDLRKYGDPISGTPISGISIDANSVIKFSDLRRKGRPLFNVLQIGINMPFHKLDKRIDARVDKQIKDGLVEETRKNYSHILKNMRIVKKRNFGARKFRFERKEGERVWQLPSMTSLGYRQIGMYLRGAKSAGGGRRKFRLDQPLLNEAIRILKRDTRRYARRQMTWFRRDKRIKWVSNKKKIETAVRRFL